MESLWYLTLVACSSNCLSHQWSVMRRYRTRVTDWLSESVTLRTELTDVTLVSEDTYWRFYWCNSGWSYSLETKTKNKCKNQAVKASQHKSKQYHRTYDLARLNFNFHFYRLGKLYRHHSDAGTGKERFNCGVKGVEAGPVNCSYCQACGTREKDSKISISWTGPLC